MKRIEAKFPVEQAVACKVLVAVAKNTSKRVDRFVLWILAAAGAALTYLFGQQKIPLHNLRMLLVIYLAAAVLAAVQRLLALIVTNAAKVFDEVSKYAEGKPNFDLARFLIIYIDSLPGVAGAAAAWSTTKILSGDLLSAGRLLRRLMAVQCLIAFAIFGLFLLATYAVFRSQFTG